MIIACCSVCKNKGGISTSLPGTSPLLISLTFGQCHCTLLHGTFSQAAEKKSCLRGDFEMRSYIDAQGDHGAALSLSTVFHFQFGLD